MNTESWENLESAPMEYFHGKLMDYFHEWRNRMGSDTKITIDGSILNNIITTAKMDTYAKYPKQNLSRAIPKSEM